MIDGLVAWLRAQYDAEVEAAPGIHVWEGRGSGETCDHVIAAGHDHCTCGVPARLLDEVAAKRRILDLYEASVARDDMMRAAMGSTPLRAATGAYEAVVRALGMALSGRPGWRPEWAPEGTWPTSVDRKRPKGLDEILRRADERSDLTDDQAYKLAQEETRAHRAEQKDEDE